ncbi:MAG: Uma2 family endonuclease [Bryobacterales bacterium]|nr:Uma2 family endonuclease [Bryobacterales bacterium]
MEKQALVAVEEYLRTSYDPDVDYVDGALEERNMGEKEHSDLQSELLHWFLSKYRKQGLTARVEFRTQVSANHFRVPDVVILEGKLRKTPILASPPVAIVEILSPEDRQVRIRARMDDYLRFGVRRCWLVDPRERRAWEYTSNGDYEIRDGILRCEAPEFSIDLPEIFATIDEMTEG